MLDKIQELDNKLLQAQMLAYLINNKKVSKILKSGYIKHFTKIFEELPNYYYSYQYEIDMKSFFNTDTSSNNITPNFITSNNYIEYSAVLNYTMKNKHMIETVLETFGIDETEENFKIMKKLMNGKIEEFTFVNEYEQEMTLRGEDLADLDNNRKNFKDQLTFTLPNASITHDINTYPLVFTYVTAKNNSLQFSIFSEEDIKSTKHYTLPKIRINRFLNNQYL